MEFTGTETSLDKQLKTKKYTEDVMLRIWSVGILVILIAYIMKADAWLIVTVITIVLIQTSVHIHGRLEAINKIQILEDILNTNTAIISKKNDSLCLDGTIELTKVIHEDMADKQIKINLDTEECILNSNTYNSIT